MNKPFETMEWGDARKAGAPMTESRISDGAQKTCCICGAILVNDFCQSCGHHKCSTCPAYVKKPNYDDLLTLHKALVEALEYWLPKDQPLPGVIDAVATEHRKRWYADRDALAEARKMGE